MPQSIAELFRKTLTLSAADQASFLQQPTFRGRSPATMPSYLAAVVLSMTVQAATVDLQVEASRTSGVAPLAVMFDATGTTGGGLSNAFHQVEYSYNFGDASSGTFSLTTNRSKNTEVGGPIAWHVFETPGTYNVLVTGTHNGKSVQKTVTITVQDPNVVYAGTATLCIDPAGTTGWGPSGAAYATSIPAPNTWTNKRIILKRGADFTAAGDFNIMDAPADCQVIAGGTGARPKLASINIGADRPPETIAVWPDRISLVDLEFTNGFRLGAMGRHHLALRCLDSSPSIEVDLGWAPYWMFDDQWRFMPLDQWKVPKYHLISDCEFPGNISSKEYNVYMNADVNFGILGTVFGSVLYHNLRVTQGWKFQISNCRFDGISNNSNYHCIKVHGGSLDPYVDSEVIGATVTRFWGSRYGCVQNNIIGSASTTYAWLVAICPENDQVAEGVTDMLVQNNQFNMTDPGQTSFVYGGRYITWIGNTATGYAFTASAGHDSALPVDWKGPYFTDRS